MSPRGHRAAVVGGGGAGEEGRGIDIATIAARATDSTL